MFSSKFNIVPTRHGFRKGNKLSKLTRCLKAGSASGKTSWADFLNLIFSLKVTIPSEKNNSPFLPDN